MKRAPEATMRALHRAGVNIIHKNHSWRMYNMQRTNVCLVIATPRLARAMHTTHTANPIQAETNSMTRVHQAVDYKK